MDPNQASTQQYPSDQESDRSYRFQLWKERLYRFFYNIWPSVNRVLTFFFYHLMRVIKGFFKIAMEEIRHGG